MIRYSVSITNFRSPSIYSNKNVPEMVTFLRFKLAKRTEAIDSLLISIGSSHFSKEASLQLCTLNVKSSQKFGKCAEFSLS